MKTTLIQHQSRLRSAERQPVISVPVRNGVGIRTVRHPAVPVWLWLAAILVFVGTVFAAKQVSAFSLGATFDNGTPSDNSDDLLDAPRWRLLLGRHLRPIGTLRQPPEMER